MSGPHEPHELALLFPPLADDDYERLRQSVTEQGLLEPVVLHEGQVLDGIHRQRVCFEVGVQPRYTDFQGKDALGFVVAKNAARRQMTRDQVADLGRRLMPMYEAQTKRGRPAAEISAESRPKRRAAEKAAEAVGTSARAVQRAKRVFKEDPDLYKQAVAGKLSLDAAERKLAAKAKPKRAASPVNGKTNPKRQRELQEEKRTGNYSELLGLQLEMSKLCSVVESYKPEEFGLEDATMALIDSFHDDLMTLSVWIDRGLLATQAWLEDVRVREKIAALRDRRGGTPAEVEAGNRLAEKLERKLKLRLVAVA